jgi:preprotein translocase subunit SecF
MIAVSVLIVMFFGGPSLIYLGLALILGLIVSTFVSLFINTCLWSFWYKKDKDNVLKRRIDAEKRKEEIKAGKKQPDDKLVV